MVIDQLPDVIVGNDTPDGNPACEHCNSARTVAVRTPDKATTYKACPVCSIAPWRIQQRVQKLLGDLPPLFVPWRLETFPISNGQQDLTVRLLRDWLDAPDEPWLYLWGPTGRGKTGLAVGLLYELALRGRSTALKSSPDLMSLIKATYGTADGESETSILDTLVQVDCFCLDDLGAEYHRSSEDWAAEKIFQLIDGRHNGLKRTIVTSNYSFPQLEERLGHSRTIRRIVELCAPRWVIDFRRLPNLGGART